MPKGRFYIALIKCSYEAAEGFQLFLSKVSLCCPAEETGGEEKRCAFTGELEERQAIMREQKIHIQMTTPIVPL